jgi:hypothetical protein
MFDFERSTDVLHFKASAFFNRESQLGQAPHPQSPSPRVEISLHDEVRFFVTHSTRYVPRSSSSAFEVVTKSHLRSHVNVALTFPASVTANALSNWARTCTGGCGRRAEFQASTRVKSPTHSKSFPTMWQLSSRFDAAAASINAHAPAAEMPHEWTNLQRSVMLTCAPFTRVIPYNSCKYKDERAAAASARDPASPNTLRPCSQPFLSEVATTLRHHAIATAAPLTAKPIYNGLVVWQTRSRQLHRA